MIKDNNNFYEMLDISCNSSGQQIKKAFRRKIKQIHPDKQKNHSQLSKEKTLTLIEIYKILIDEKLRKEYDQKLNFFKKEDETKNIRYFTKQTISKQDQRPSTVTCEQCLGQTTIPNSVYEQMMNNREIQFGIECYYCNLMMDLSLSDLQS